MILKLKNRKHHTVGTVPKSNSKIVEKDTIDSRNTEIHDAHLSRSVQTLQ